MSINLYPGDSVDAREQILVDLLHRTPSGCIRFNISQGYGLVVLLVVFSFAALSVIGVLGKCLGETFRLFHREGGL